MAKINLLTRHFNDNCGTVLQAYATCKILESMGHTVTVVNLQDRHQWKEFFSKSFYKNISRLKFMLFRQKYFSKMTHVKRHLTKNDAKNVDYFIVGSDQVWNRTITKQLFFDYFLVPIPNNCKKIALSSSFGHSVWNESYIDTMIVKKALECFDAISVRENSGKIICKQIFGIDAVELIDPTIAYNGFSCFIKNVALKDEVSFYSFKPQGYICNVVEIIATREKLPIRNVGSYRRSRYLSGNQWTQGPIEWLRYIAQSKIFVSDSFHGIVFAILLHKQFIATVAHKERFDRIQSLLKSLSLENHIVLDTTSFERDYHNILSPIDYEQVDRVIKSKQNDFISYMTRHIT